jgi:hypothetical protein
MSFLTKAFDIKEQICTTRSATVLLSVDKNKLLVTGNINIREKTQYLGYTESRLAERMCCND